MPDEKPKMRLRRCGVKGRIPFEPGQAGDELVFECQADAGHLVHPTDIATWHNERTIVDMGNGTAREFAVFWRDLGVTTVRRRKPNARPQRA